MFLYSISHICASFLHLHLGPACPLIDPNPTNIMVSLANRENPITIIDLVDLRVHNNGELGKTALDSLIPHLEEKYVRAVYDGYFPQ